GQTTWSHGDVTGSGEPRAYATINSYRDGSNYHTDYVETYRADADPDFAGQLYQSKGANLAQTSGSVSRGTFNPSTKAFTVGSSGDHWRELKFNGSTSSTGADSVTSFNSQSCPAVYLIPNKSTLDVTIRIAQGYVYRTETYVYTGSGNFSLMTSEDFDYDAYGHLTQRSASNGALTNYSYPNGRLTSTTDPAGTETQFTYDAIGRVATSVKKGAAAFGSYAAQGDITTTPTYDGANNVTRTVVSGGALSQTAATPFDLAGRLTSSTAPGGYTTAFAYSSGGKVITATLPGGATRITETYLDGQAKSLTGTAVVAEYYSYSVNSTTGTITRQVNFGTSASTALVKTTTDWLGRKIKEERPTFSGSGTFTLTFTYNSLGQLVARSETGLSDALYSYDTLGTLTREGLDIGGNGTLDLASSDRITDHAWTFFTASSAWWKRDTTTTYATASSSTSTQLGKVETQLSGLPTNRLTRTDSTDIFGNVTSQFVDVNRSGKLVTTTTDAPDSTTDTQQIAYNGLVVSSRDTANLTTTFGHDALGRPVTSVDPRTGTTTTAYVSGTSQVSTVTDPASIVQATYTYDSAGRVSSVKDALNKYAYTSYTTRGEVYRQWGDTTYPVENGYDTWGRRTTMKTYRAGSGWTGSTWPTGTTGTADTTTWAYQESTGLLSSKTDAANKAVTYTYTARGQIDVRTWARGVTTDYGYSATTGELTSVNYSDSTPDLAYTYNRLGSSANVTDYTGTRTLNYNLAGTLEMQSEDLPAFFGSRRITWPHATSGIIGRPTGLQLGTSGSPTSEQNVTWGYDPYGRFNSLAGGGTTLAYTYATNSNLLASIADTASGWTQTRSYVTNRDLLDIIETKISTTSKAKFDYAHDNLGRRTSVNKTGDLYSRYGNGSQGLDTAWGYDDRSQVTSEQTKLGGSATVLTGRDDAYAFDNIGNRATATHNSQLTTYTSTLLNTYSQRTVPGVFDVAGAAGSGTTVTVNGSSSGVTRHGEYFFNGQSMSNGSGAVFSTLAVSDGTTATNLGAFLAGTPEAFSYDDDGNLLSDGRWDYVYDAENRLVSMQTHTALSPTPLANADARRIEFKSDYLGRRVQKTVRDGWNGSTFATVVSDEKFVYDGWNCIAKLNASSLSLIASYFWGLDWSGTLQGAGGVGGLALTVEGGNTYLPMFDGNGNVMGMIKASDGSLAAAYEYDAFGNTLRESGPYAASNPFRFSTKYTDLETGLVYYGLRYYAPWLGRFLCRDPKEEDGGRNLYAF
ncbi:MAG TPA: RHS repeat-associated core domain-containing protein, partial [Lacunisphaera sp.]|nr:RHS repeat-associated core domain-containing protein [Lacunisphaera sp.]